MGLLRRLLGRKKRGQPGGPGAHLMEFIRTRQGVEAYLEPKTAVTEMTVVLVASDGEWTRRRVPNAEVVHRFANKLGIPVYDVNAVGYPEKMREWNQKRKAAGETVEDIERPA